MTDYCKSYGLISKIAFLKTEILLQITEIILLEKV